MTHRQDRHNCSVQVNLKLFLSDLSHWRVQVCGAHVPDNTDVQWQSHPPEKQLLDEDQRDLIISLSSLATGAQVADILTTKAHDSKGRELEVTRAVPKSKKQISSFVSSMRRRRREKNYSVVDSEEKDKCQALTSVSVNSGKRKYPKQNKTSVESIDNQTDHMGGKKLIVMHDDLGSLKSITSDSVVSKSVVSKTENSHSQHVTTDLPIIRIINNPSSSDSAVTMQHANHLTTTVHDLSGILWPDCPQPTTKQNY